MIPEKDISALLYRIEQSNSIGASSTYSRLLRFLVECTQSNTIPKEQVIAEHLFGKHFAKSDSSKVRVYVFHLRKKLNQYFENEGHNESYILSIPKGAYRVQFTENRPVQRDKTSKSTHTFRFLPLWIILGISLFSNILFLLKHRYIESSPLVTNSSWKEFFEDDQPIQIVVGDLLIFSETDPLTGKTRNVRIPSINTLNQFEEYTHLKENEGRNQQKMTYAHLLRGSTEWVSSLTKIFHPRKEFYIRSGSRIEAKDLHDYNIIFVGMQKTAGLLNSYFDRSKFNYDVAQPNIYTLQNEDGVQSFTPQGDPNHKHSDYGFIAKYPGPNDNTIFMFGGLWDSAVSESLRNFVVPSKINLLESQMKATLGHIPPYFEMLIEVNGVDRIGFETKILHLNEIETPR